ncbi:MAG: hypothetical protein QOI21_2263 [Actinomycetota bacterium]|jgi:transcriptional regulator with XRE-family HTH domain|nr:hypothetical protein [Actinomycetota bacterium]
MVIEESTARARELGGELKRVRERAKLSGHALARSLGWPAPKISRLENGKRGVSEVDVAIYLARCGATPDELERFIALAHVTDHGYRLQEHSAGMPDELRSLIVLETSADMIAGYEPFFIPGLLQTESYVREMLKLGGRKPGRGFEMRVEARLARQALFNRRWPPQLTFYIHEYALRSMVGDSVVMYEQALHLVLATSWSRCEIRVVPESAQVMGVFGGGFHLMEYADHPAVVSVETHTASAFLEGDEHIPFYRNLQNELGAVALNGGQSRDLLAELASEHERVESTRDDRPGPRSSDLA